MPARKHLIIKLFALPLLAVVCSCILSLGLNNNADAWSERYGYFTGHQYSLDDYSRFVLPAVTSADASSGGLCGSGDAIPSCINTVSEFINLLKYRNQSDDQNSKVGSAYITYTLLGNTSGSGLSTTVSDNNWTQLFARLQASNASGNINWSTSITGSKNTIYRENSGTGDITWYSDSKSGTGILIKVGSSFYRLLRDCGNTIGDSEFQPGLSAVSWSLSASSQVKKKGGSYSSETIQVYPDDKLKWKHTVTNNSDSTNAMRNIISVKYENNASFNGGASGGLGIIDGVTEPLAASGSKVFELPSDSSTYYTVQNDDVDKNLCQKIYASPKGATNSGSVSSSYSCAHVNKKDTTPPGTWSFSTNTQVGSTPSSTGNWSGYINGRNNTNPLSVKVGDTYSWNHQAIKSGSANVDKEVEYRYTEFDFTLNSSSDGGAGFIHSGTVLSSGSVVETASGTYTATASQVDHMICRRTYLIISSSKQQYSDYSCIQVTSANTPPVDPPTPSGSWRINPYLYIKVNGEDKVHTYEGSNDNTIEVDASTGASIQWYSILINSGSDSTPDAVTYKYQNGNFTYLSSDNSWDDGPEYSNYFDAGESSENYIGSTIYANADDIGETFCRRLRVNNPSRSDHPSWNTDTGYACVKIVGTAVTGNWHISPEVHLIVDGVHQGMASENSDNDSSKNAVVVDVRPDQEVFWDNRVTNTGTDASPLIVYGYLNKPPFSFGGYGLDGDYLTESASISAGGSDLFRSYATSGGTKFIVKAEDIGETFCRQTYVYAPSRSDHPTWTTESDYACVRVVAGSDYDLSPKVNALSKLSQPGDAPSVGTTVTNTGSTPSVNVNYELTQVIFHSMADASAYSTMTDNDEQPCASGGYLPYSNGVGNLYKCSTIKTGTQIFNANAAKNYVDSSITGIGNIPDSLNVGDVVCYALSIKPHKNGVSDTEWRHSSLSCTTIAKKPKFQVWGGDLLIKGSIQAAASTKSSAMFGSWSEYGVIAFKNGSNGAITKFGSGAAFAGVTGLISYSTCKYSKLSFNNANTSATCSDTGVIGNYNNSTYTQPDVAVAFPDSAVTLSGTVRAEDLASGTYMAGGDITLSTSQLGAGKSIIIKAQANTITISGDQTYDDGPYDSVTKIPQLVIIANKIIIKSDVSRVDSWLVASGAVGLIETCDTGSTTFALSGDSRLTNSKCNSQLRINGPVIAKKLWLRRTYGAESVTPGEPAEVINLRADAYIWAATRSSSKSSMNTVYTVEAPVRY